MGTSFIKLIERVGFFRLTLIPLGLTIIATSIVYGILGMGLIGGVVLVFGIFNKCLLLGQCEIENHSEKKLHR